MGMNSDCMVICLAGLMSFLGTITEFCVINCLGVAFTGIASF